MNAFAPTYIPIPPFLHTMEPGQLFRLRLADGVVYALLHHSQVGVADARQIWCVVVATGKGYSEITGQLVSLPRDAEVQRVRAVRLDLALLD